MLSLRLKECGKQPQALRFGAEAAFKLVRVGVDDNIIILVSISLSWLLDSTMQGWDTLQLIAVPDNRLMDMNDGSAFNLESCCRSKCPTLFALSSTQRQVALFVLKMLFLKLSSDTGS